MIWVVKDGDGFAFGRSDLVVAALEIDGVVIVDPAGAAQGEMQIQKRRCRTRAKRAGFLKASGLPDFPRDAVGGAAAGGVEAGDFHLKNGVCLLVVLNLGEGHEGDQTPLEGAKAAFDFSFCLRCGSDQMGDAQSGEGTLELALGIGVVVG